MCGYEPACVSDVASSTTMSSLSLRGCVSESKREITNSSCDTLSTCIRILCVNLVLLLLVLLWPPFVWCQCWCEFYRLYYICVLFIRIHIDLYAWVCICLRLNFFFVSSCCCSSKMDLWPRVLLFNILLDDWVLFSHIRRSITISISKTG